MKHEALLLAEGRSRPEYCRPESKNSCDLDLTDSSMYMKACHCLRTVSEIYANVYDVLGSRVTKILVVEDDPSLRSMIRLIFELAGYEVVEAGDGKAALDLMGGPQLLPDIVTTDLMMPIMNGDEFIRRLRSEARTASIPIVVVSANAKAAEGVQASERGADALVSKPFIPASLVRLIESLNVGALGHG